MATKAITDKSVPTRPVDSSTGIRATTRNIRTRFTEMALESSDFTLNLKPVTPIVFFAEHIDNSGKLVLDLMIDFGYFTTTGIRIREWSGQILLADGSKMTDFRVTFKAIPVGPQNGGQVFLNVHRNERTLPNGEVINEGDFNVGGLGVYRIAGEVWFAYQQGKFAAIDHEAAGVRRLSQEELKSKIEAAMSAKANRIARREQLRQIDQQTTTAPEAAVELE